MKEILKKHYDKVILAGLAFCFVLALLYLLQMVESAKNVTESDLRFQAPRRKYEVRDFADKSFDIVYKLGEQSVWSDRTDSSKMGFTAELAVPMQAMRCQHENCKKIMPVVVAQTKKVCPFCEGALADVTDYDYAKEIAQKDSDGDGMPDRYERRMGFKLDDAQDAGEDRDGDGFSNLYEFLSETDPNDKGNYPSLHKCLYLSSLKRDPMKMKLISVTAVPDPADKKSKKNWTISLTANNEPMPMMLSIGDTFKVENTTYKIIDATNVISDKQTAGVLVNDDKSSITIAPYVNNKPDLTAKMEIKVGSKVYKPMSRAIIRDVRKSNKRYEVGKGETFQITSEEGEKVRFIVKDVQDSKKIVIIEDVEKGEAFELPQRSRIKNAYVKKDDNNTSDTPRRRRSNRNRRR